MKSSPKKGINFFLVSLFFFLASSARADTTLRFIDRISSADIHLPYSKNISQNLWKEIEEDLAEMPQLDVSRFKRSFTFDNIFQKRIRLLQKKGQSRIVDYYPPASEGIISCRISLDNNAVGGLVLAKSTRNYKIIALGRKSYNFLLVGTVEKKYCRWDYFGSISQVEAVSSLPEEGDLQLTVVFRGPVLLVFVNRKMVYISTSRPEDESYRIGIAKLIDNEKRSGVRITDIRHRNKVEDDFLDVTFLMRAHLQVFMENDRASEYASNSSGDLICRPGISNEFRTALLFAPDTRITFPVKISPDTFLKFGLGTRSLDGETRNEDNYFHIEEENKNNLFQVDLIDEHGQITNIFSRTFFSDNGISRYWRDVYLDLSPYAGFQGDIAWSCTQMDDDAIPGEVLFVAGPMLTSPSSAQKKPANVVLFLIDSLRADRLGCYGNSLRITPEIDKWAQNGVRFSNCYAQAPWALPSLTTLFTSRHPYTHGVRFLGDIPDLNLSTLAQMLRKKGYVTASFSENIITGRVSGLDRGFDFLHFNRVDFVKVREWIQENRDRPFFLYVHIMDPHLRYLPPDNYLPEGITAEKAEDINRQILELTRPLPFSGDLQSLLDTRIALQDRLRQILPDIKRLYNREVAVADYRFGEMMRMLKDLHLEDETLTILTSEHGEEFAEHGELLHGRSLYNSALRVPLILRLPGPVRHGRVVSHPAGLMDIFPTVMDILGEKTSGTQGKSLQDIILGGPGNRQRRMFAIRNSIQVHSPARGKKNISVIEGKWKAIYNQDPETMELYNIIADPEELKNEASTYPDQAQIYKDIISNWLEGQ